MVNPHSYLANVKDTLYSVQVFALFVSLLRQWRLPTSPEHVIITSGSKGLFNVYLVYSLNKEI